MGANVEFYSGRARASVGTIDELLSWRGCHDRLEANHAYIQWLFPNYFPSRFNPDAEPLTRHEAREFRQNPTLALKYVASYELFLDFLGLRLEDRQTGFLVRAQDDPAGARLRTALVIHTHNQMRVQRILASLTVLGFSRYAQALVSRLHWEVTGDYWHPTGSSGVLVAQQRSWPPAGVRDHPALHELGSRPLSTWQGYIPGAQDFERNTQATADDLQESVFFRLKG